MCGFALIDHLFDIFAFFTRRIEQLPHFMGIYLDVKARTKRHVRACKSHEKKQGGRALIFHLCKQTGGSHSIRERDKRLNESTLPRRGARWMPKTAWNRSWLPHETLRQRNQEQFCHGWIVWSLVCSVTLEQDVSFRNTPLYRDCTGMIRLRSTTFTSRALRFFLSSFSFLIQSKNDVSVCDCVSLMGAASDWLAWDMSKQSLGKTNVATRHLSASVAELSVSEFEAASLLHTSIGNIQHLVSWTIRQRQGFRNTARRRAFEFG